MQRRTTEKCASKQLEGILLVESLDFERLQRWDLSVNAQLRCHPGEEDRQSTLSARGVVKDRYSAIGTQPQELNHPVP